VVAVFLRTKRKSLPFVSNKYKTMRRKSNKIPKLHVKKGDTVKVLSGNENIRGKQGQVLQVNPMKRVAIVEGLNMVVKHRRQPERREEEVQDDDQDTTNKFDGRFNQEAPIPVCKLQVIDPKTGQPTRIGRRRVTDEEKNASWERYSKKSNITLD